MAAQIVSAGPVMTVRCDDAVDAVCESVRTETELISIGSSKSSESGVSSSVCSVCSETDELSAESSAEWNAQTKCANDAVDEAVVHADTGLFCAKLQKKHRAEAAAWVKKCRKEGKNPLDTCGERGDLFFLIQSEWSV